MSPTLLREPELVSKEVDGRASVEREVLLQDVCKTTQSKTLPIGPFLYEAQGSKGLGGKGRDSALQEAIRITGTLSVSF